MPSVDASVESLQIDPMKRVWLLASVGAAVGVVATGVVAVVVVAEAWLFAAAVVTVTAVVVT